jgi:hypothetical protein
MIKANAEQAISHLDSVARVNTRFTPTRHDLFVGAKLATMPAGTFYGQEVFAHQNTGTFIKFTKSEFYICPIFEARA